MRSLKPIVCLQQVSEVTEVKIKKIWCKNPKLINFGLTEMQACIYLLKICTIPRHNHKWDYFSQFSDKYFFYFSSYKITWQVDYIYVYNIYVCYIQLVSFQTKKIWVNEAYFHYLLHLRWNPCLQQVEKFYLLFSSRTCLGLRRELHL